MLTRRRRKHYLRPGTDLTLDWRPLLKEWKGLVLPSETGMMPVQGGVRRSPKTLAKLCSFAQLYFDPQEIPAVFEETLPYFTTSFAEGAFIAVGLLNLLFPTMPPTEAIEQLLPQNYLPTMFHLWSLVNRSRVFDTTFLDLFSRLARDSLQSLVVPFSEFGIHTREQSSTIFTAILRLLDIPVGQASSPYSSVVDVGAGLGIMLERDSKKHPVAHQIARWIVMSLSPACLDRPASIMTNLEGLIEAVETFFHPSNSGGWTKNLSQLVFYLTDFFVMRWNREESGELEMPEERKVNNTLKRRFVVCLRDVVFMGIYGKSGTAVNFSLASLQNLAYLEPDLILPGALQRIYPSMQGLVEVHRTASSLRSLQVLAKTMVRTKGFRCHVTTMLGLALPGIDANDLDKTLYTLSYFQSVCYSIPLHDLTKGRDDVRGSMLALDWISSEVARMEEQGADVQIDYKNGLSDMDEELVLRSSTASFPEFLTSFLGKVFTLLENLPDASRPRSGSPEENVVNTLPATFTPLLASLSPEMYDLALNKIADFISNHVINQARDAMAFICSTVAKIDPAKALKRLVPVLIQSIRTEIDDNAAASTRNTGTDVLPRDRALVWSISMLSMSVVHVGDAVLQYRTELLEIATYMQQKCIGLPTTHISNFVHHLLLNLTGIYTIDYSLYEDDVLARGLTPQDWGAIPDVQNMTIKWHVPNKEEIEFAVELLKNQGERALQQLQALTNGTSNIKRDGVGKGWSDEVSRNLMLLRLLLSGVSVLFDPTIESQNVDAASDNDIEMTDADGTAPERDEEADDDLQMGPSDTDKIKPQFIYASGYQLKEGDGLYNQVHDFRERTGRVLHEVHQFLVLKQEDDVACFEPLCMAYKSWFIDVGIERSAHVLDRVTKLLAADIQPYKVVGLRKEYPRPLLLRRANVYHLQRLRHNSYPRQKSALSKQLALDLAQSSVSAYRDVRRHAQSAGEAALKAIVGARTLVVPIFITALEAGVRQNDFFKIKGAIYSLLFGSLNKTISRDWRYAPLLIKTFLEASTVDRPSIQKLCAGSTMLIIDLGKPIERLAILNRAVVHTIAPEQDVSPIIEESREITSRKRTKIEDRKAELSDELVDLARESHWRLASRTGAIILGLGLRFERIASENMIDLVSRGAIDSHPSLRLMYAQAFVALMSLVDYRAIADHSYKNFLSSEQHLPIKFEAATQRNDPNWTSDFLSGFAKPDTEYYIDHDYPGWLVWNKSMVAYKSNPTEDLNYDEIEKSVRRQIGSILDRAWFSTFFEYLKQEPRDSAADRFGLTRVMLLADSFDLMRSGESVVKFDDIKELTESVWGGGSDKHQHRATSEILGALVASADNEAAEYRTKIWNYVFPKVQQVISDGLTPENLTYWSSFLHWVVQGKDPRRVWPLVEWLASLRLDKDSNAAFKEGSKIKLLHGCIADLGWHFQLEKPIIDDFLKYIDHPYKAVREAVGPSLSDLFRTRYHESYKDVPTLIQSQKEASSLGTRPYQPSEEFTNTIHEIFERLEKWRQERTPGDQKPSPYTSGSKTVLLWLDSTLSSFECTQLIPFFPNVFMEQLLYMMDIREDQELQGLAYMVFRQFPNIPHRLGEDTELIAAMIRIGKASPSWHQRLRVLINVQVVYFRRLFLISYEQQMNLLECAVSMLEDTQLEVRLGASATLSGMIRCSPSALRAQIIQDFVKRFTKMLLDSPLPKKAKKFQSGVSTPNTGTSTPTPEHNKIVLKRHAAVLGLGALVSAFPYMSPPPSWIPEVLTTLASKANNDPGMVGNSVKNILSDFKKTRQDTWQIDLKVWQLCSFINGTSII